MSYRRYKNLDKNLLFAEYFSSEQEVRRNGLTPSGSGISYNQGKYLSDGTNNALLFDERHFGTEHSIRVRAKCNTLGTWEGFIGNSGGIGHYDYLARNPSNQFVWQDKDQQTTTSTTAYADTDFHDIIISYKPGTQVIYVDGVADGTGGAVGQPMSLSEIGRFWSNAVYALDGEIDFIEIYNKALTAEEVSNLYGG